MLGFVLHCTIQCKMQRIIALHCALHRIAHYTVSWIVPNTYWKKIFYKENITLHRTAHRAALHAYVPNAYFSDIFYQETIIPESRLNYNVHCIALCIAMQITEL